MRNFNESNKKTSDIKSNKIRHKDNVLTVTNQYRQKYRRLK